MIQTNGPDALEETLSRLSKKPGVKATIALDRSSGAILKTAGQISLVRPALQQSPSPSTTTQKQEDSTDGSSSNNKNSANSETQGAEELAGMVWGFVNAAGGLVEGLDTEVSLPFLAHAFSCLANLYEGGKWPHDRLGCLPACLSVIFALPRGLVLPCAQANKQVSKY